MRIPRNIYVAVYPKGKIKIFRGITEKQKVGLYNKETKGIFKLRKVLANE